MDKRVGCLLIHGFSGSVHEIEPLNEYLLNKGFITACPELKGHTGKRRDLARVSYNDWITSAEEYLLKLSSTCENIILIGFSMGGLIAFNLALNHQVSKLITLSTPIYCWDKKRFFLNIIGDIKTGKLATFERYGKAAIRTPFSAIINFEILKHKTKAILKQIDYPIFIAQGLIDDTVQRRSADYIYSNVSSKQKNVSYYNNSNHFICLSSDKDRLFEDVLEFIQNNPLKA